jgi:hypothetical protein
MSSFMVRSWRDLERFGINALTGENCAVGRRVLCDLTENGRQIYLEACGLPPDQETAPNWNSGGKFSANIPYAMLDDIAIFAMLKAGYEAIYIHRNGTVQGASGEDKEHIDSLIQMEVDYCQQEYERTGEIPKSRGYFGDIRRILNPGRMRNEHVATGRTY